MGKKRKRAKRKFTIPVAVVAGMAAGMVEPIEAVVLRQDFGGALWALTKNYTGWDGQQFNLNYLMKGLVPLAIGIGVHKFVGGTLGANRMLAAANVPIIRI